MSRHCRRSGLGFGHRASPPAVRRREGARPRSRRRGGRHHRPPRPLWQDTAPPSGPVPGRRPHHLRRLKAAQSRRLLLGPRAVSPTKQMVPPAPLTDSHHDDRTPVIQTTGPQDLESAGRGYRRDADRVLNAHHLAWTHLPGGRKPIVDRRLGRIAEAPAGRDDHSRLNVRSGRGRVLHRGSIRRRHIGACRARERVVGLGSGTVGRVAAADEVASASGNRCSRPLSTCRRGCTTSSTWAFCRCSGRDQLRPTNGLRRREHPVPFRSVLLLGRGRAPRVAVSRSTSAGTQSGRDAQLEQVRDAFSSSAEPEILLRIFRGEQRAIGEVMLDPTESAVAGLPRWDCLGYAAFVEKREDGTSRTVVPPAEVRSERPAVRERAHGPLVDVQHALLELIRTLDPSAERVSATMLTPLEKEQRPNAPRVPCRRARGYLPPGRCGGSA